MNPKLDLLRRLIRARADVALIGGMAGVVHGSSLVTRDVDVCAKPGVANMVRILAAVKDLDPRDGRSTDAPPLQRSAEDLAASADVSLLTSAGRLDILWDVPGVGAWPDVKASSEATDLGEGDSCLVLGLDALIASKRAVGRTRDLVAVEELEEIRRRRDAR